MAFWNNLFRKKPKEKESRVVAIRAPVGSKQTIWPERGYDNFAKETYLKNATAFAAIYEVGKSTASVPWKVFSRNKDGTREEVPEDPLNKVFVRANPQESFRFVMLKTISYLVMCGNAFNERVRLESGPNKGQIRELYSHRPDRFKLDTVEGRLREYIYQSGGKEPATWEVDPITGESDILQLKTFHPLNDWWGAASTESGAREIDTSNSATEWNKNLLDNQGRPGMIYTLVGDTGANFMDDLEMYLESRSGPSNAGKDIIITGDRGTGVAPYGWSPTDMDFGEGDIRLMRKIAMIYGVPPELLGIESSTFNNRKEARLFFWQGTVIWWLNYIKDEFNNWLFPQDSTLFVDYILDKVPAFAEERERLWKMANEATFASMNEKRELAGLDNWGSEGDVILIDASKIPLGMESGETELEEEIEGEEEESRKFLIDQGYNEEEIEEMLGISDYKSDEPEDFKPYANEFS